MSDISDKPELKHCILAAAANLFAKLGLDKCSTREIAKQSDANISLISYHFGGKEGLYKEVMRAHALEIKANAQEVLSKIDLTKLDKETFVFHMEQVIGNIIATRLKNPEVSQILSREKLAGMPFSKDIHEEIFYPLVQHFFRLVKTAQEKGFVKKEINPALFFIAMSEAIWGYYEIMSCNTNLSKDCGEYLNDPEKLKKQILSIYITGVLI